MADEVAAGAEDIGDVFGVPLEVDPAIRRRRAKTAAVDEQQAIALGERPLLAERLLARAKAAVHEDGRLAVTPDRDVQPGPRAHSSELTRSRPPRRTARPARTAPAGGGRRRRTHRRRPARTACRDSGAPRPRLPRPRAMRGTAGRSSSRPTRPRGRRRTPRAG